MNDELKTINGMLQDHAVTEKHVRTLINSLSDQDEIFLRNTWTSTDQELFRTIQEDISNIITSLYDRISEHYEQEINLLKPFIGEMMLQGLSAEHREVINILEELKGQVKNYQVDQISREDLISRIYEIRHHVQHAIEALEDHSSKEEAILKLLRMSLLQRRLENIDKTKS